MTGKILFVDDDPNVLAAFQRQFRRLFVVETASGGQEGLELLTERGPFSVIVSDLRMPGMDGVQFLTRARKAAPDSTRMMLTGYADLQTAIEAVNEGNIFRFLTKPCDPDVLARAIQDGVRQHQLIISERELLEKTLRGSVKVLTEILELVNPEAFGRASRITHYVREVAVEMQEEHLWQLETAAALSQIGCVILPEKALKKIYKGVELSSEEKQLFDMHPLIGSDLIAHIPRMKSVSEIIANQEKHYDGSGTPVDTLQGDHIPIGARILKAVLDFDTLQAAGISKFEALAQMAERTGSYDPGCLAALDRVIRAESRYREMSVSLAGLMDGMILGEDLWIRDGRLLAAKGYTVNRTLRHRLFNFAEKPGIKEPIKVLVPVEE